MKRRDFIKTGSLAVPMIGIFPADLTGVLRSRKKNMIEKRALGRTGEMLSVIGFGGIVVRDSSPEEASRLVAMAVNAGINYFDVAPSYGDAEIKLGPALEPYRKDVFLACKTTERKREGARKELENSLKNLRTDHFDLYQHHAVTTLPDVETLLGPGGSMETFLEAKKEGKIRYIGFSAHSVEAAMALMDGFDFDTILFPFNYATWHKGNFGPQVMEKARDKGMGILALKAMAKGPWQKGADRTRYPKCWYEPLIGEEEIKMGLRFTLSHPVTAAIPPGEAELFSIAVNLRNEIKPLSQKEVMEIKEKAAAGVPLFSYEATA
ncbi:MAG TPA: aldo/keto reductase [Bacteroidales bacterium]|jgi:aryl-alcohol dehydrogenase-like predicted oxidoreductase|nr:aldo/keto reductase [Bacteroidales bacterium]